MKNILQNYLNLLSEKQNAEVEYFRNKNNRMYLYHGTLLKNVDLIKKFGIKGQIVKLSKQKFPAFEPEGKYYNTKVVWLTSYKKFAKSFAIGEFSFKGSFFEKYRGPILLVNIYTKYLDYLKYKVFLEPLLFDEYIYIQDIPPKDIVWPDTEKYKEIESTFSYLKK